MRGFRLGEDWAVLSEREEDAELRTLVRRIVSFRKVGEHYRRDDEVHRVRLYAPDELSAELREVGFEARDHLSKLAVGPRGFEVGTNLAPRLRQLVRPLELLQSAPGLGGGVSVREDGRVAHPLLRVGVGTLELGDEVLDRGHR